MSATIGEVWDFEFYEKQKEQKKLFAEYEARRKEKYGNGTDIDDFEAKKE